MIKYQLICEKNHEFEGWFQTSSSFDEQAVNGLLRCPLCDSDKVKRALMTPNLASSKRRSSSDLHLVEPDQTPTSSTRSKDLNPSIKPELKRDLGEAFSELRQLQRKIAKECRNVGDNFAEEARKIHYGEKDAEGIYGQATQKEREALEDEGIEVFNMPWIPPDQ